jgi:hypothetical protein
MTGRAGMDCFFRVGSFVAIAQAVVDEWSSLFA